MSTSGGHAPYGRSHVVPSAVSLAGVYVSPAKLACKRCRLPRAGKAGFLPISAGKASETITSTHASLSNPPSSSCIIIVIVNLTQLVLYNYCTVQMSLRSGQIYTHPPFHFSNLTCRSQPKLSGRLTSTFNSTTRYMREYFRITIT